MSITSTNQKIYTELLSNNGVSSILAYANDDTYDISKQSDEIITQILNLRKCITYIANAKFDIEGYTLFEIPLNNMFVFYNKVEEKMFDLVIHNSIVTPAYLDSNYTCRDAESIQNAIKLYSIPS